MAGQLFCPTAPELKAIKAKAHRLNQIYNGTSETDTTLRAALLTKMFKQIGPGGYVQGPVYLHYGTHTTVGAHFFGNFNLTIQDDAPVTIGAHCDFGPNTTIVTPIHPMLASEREHLQCPDGQPRRLIYAKPVVIGDRCWLGANVVVCAGVTIGDDCVIGAGSVVTRDVPANSFAAGNPCRVIRTLGEADSIARQPERLAGCRVIDAHI